MRNLLVVRRLKRWIFSYLSLVRALLLRWRHRLAGKRPRGIFLHSLFRSGSTYIFNVFRNAQGFWCYYEPLHHQLVDISEDRLAVFRFDKKTTDMMSHPSLDRPHFYEFKEALHNNRIPFFNKLMSYNEFTAVRQHARLYLYIMTLLQRAPENLTPFLQFNRSSLRIGWFRRFFDNSLHIYMLRNRRDQFESYCRQGEKYNIFLAINLYIIAANRGYKKIGREYSSFSRHFKVTHDLEYDLKRLAYLAGTIDKKVHYRIFLHLWIHSLLEAGRYADFIIDMDKLSESRPYRQQIVARIKANFPVAVEIFEDCRLRRYDVYSLDEAAFREIETEMAGLYAGELKEIDVEL